MIPVDDNTVFRVYFQKICKVYTSTGGRVATDLTFYLETMIASQVSLFGWSETNTS